jgi:hypothetical protein
MHGAILSIVKKCRIFCSLVASTIASGATRVAMRIFRDDCARRRFEGTQPLKIFFLAATDCASHKLICAKLRRNFRRPQRPPRAGERENPHLSKSGVAASPMSRTRGDRRVRERDAVARTIAIDADAVDRFAGAETIPAARGGRNGEAGMTQANQWSSSSSSSA